MAASRIMINVADLVEQMPRTDREIEAQKAAEQVPADPSKPRPQPVKDMEDSKFTGPDTETASKICDQILAGGRRCLEGLLGLIRHPADPEFKNYKAEYLLHCLTIRVGRPGKEAQRKMFVEIVSEWATNTEVAGPVREFLVRELQLVGGRECLKPLSRLLADSDLCQAAASALVAIGEDSVPLFLNALPEATGKRRLAIAHAFSALGSKTSVKALRRLLEDQDGDTRLTAAWGLARLGDEESADLLMKTADAAVSFERVKVTQACLLLAENLAARGKKATAARIYTHMRDTRTDPREKHIRDLAAKSLAALPGST